MINVAIFASGRGSNAENIHHFFKNHPSIHIVLFAGNKKEAGVSLLAEKLNVPFCYFSSSDLKDKDFFLNKMKEYDIDWIVLAGFLLKIPDFLIEAFPKRIINIHPSLLPKYGGKGMYGEYVHKAVLEAGEAETGISIHLIDENYDEGDLVFQAKCSLDETDDLASIQNKIQGLEHKYFPKVIEELILEENKEPKV